MAALRSAWAAVRPGGRLVVLDWCLPPTVEESRSLHGAMLWGIQIDELYQGTRIWDLAGYLAQFEDAGVPAPAAIDLPSGATLFAIGRPAARPARARPRSGAYWLTVTVPCMLEWNLQW